MREPATELFAADDHLLEGILEEAEPAGTGPGLPDSRPAGGTLGVVVAHPHPLHGGTMNQPVVYRTAKACRERGLATLRFNFPSVGRSGGRYTGHEEYRDVEQAVEFIRRRIAPVGQPTNPVPVGVAGYSFGSVMAALACGGPVRIDALALIAFPIDWKDVLSEASESLAAYQGPVLAVCGEADPIAPPAPVRDLLSSLDLDFRMEVLGGAGHLFEKSRGEAARLVAEFMHDSLVKAVQASPT